MNLVHSPRLATHLNGEDVLILDVRSDVMHDVPGPVPNAVHLQDFSLCAPNHGVPAHSLPPEWFRHLFARAGITDDHQVVSSQGERVTKERMVHV